MSRRLTTVPPATPLRELLPIFEQGMVAIVMEGDRFLGLVTRIDALNHLRRKMA
jgi:cystathionine beta-synthase